MKTTMPWQGPPSWPWTPTESTPITRFADKNAFATPTNISVAPEDAALLSAVRKSS